VFNYKDFIIISIYNIIMNNNSNQEEIIPETEIDSIDNLCLGIDFGTTNSCLSVWYKN